MRPIDPPVRASTVEEVLSAIADGVPLSRGSTHGSTVSSSRLISEDTGVSTYLVDVSVDRSWDVYGTGDDGAFGQARVRVRPCTGGYEAFEVENC